MIKRKIYSFVQQLPNIAKLHYQYIPFAILILVLALPINFFVLARLLHLPQPKPTFDQPIIKRPHFNRDKLMNGILQKEYEYWFNENNPARSDLVKINNQFYYSLFTKSLMYDANLIIGKKGYLYEKIYINQYVNLKNKNFTLDEFRKWAQQLREISDYFAKRGQLFVYLLTPSKASFYPEYFPESYEKLIRDPRPDYYLKIKALKESGVVFFDASEYMLQSKAEKYGNLLFSRGGTHWTMLGAALSTKKLLEVISQHLQTPLPPFEFTYKPAFDPKFTDKDLLTLCKLLFPPNHYRVPDMTFTRNEKPAPLKAAVIGGSFTHFFKTLFAETNYFTQLDHYYYLILNHYRLSADGRQEEVPHEKDNMNSYQDIFAADVVIFEENELLPYSNHLREFYFKLFGTKPTA